MLYCRSCVVGCQNVTSVTIITSHMLDVKTGGTLISFNRGYWGETGLSPEPQLRYCNQHSSFSDINIVVSVCRAHWDYYIWPPLALRFAFPTFLLSSLTGEGGGGGGDVDSGGDKDMPARLSWQSPCQLGPNIKLDNWTTCSVRLSIELEELNTTLHFLVNSTVSRVRLLERR